MNKAGVTVSTGSIFYSTKNSDVHFRISIAHRTEEDIEKGIKIIANILNNL